MISSYPYQPLYCDKSPSRYHTEPFCRRLSPTKSFGPLRGGFLIFRENLQTGDRPAILHTCTLKTAQAVWIWIPRHDPAQNAGEPDNAAVTQGQERRFGASGDPRNRRHFYWHLHSQLWKSKSSLKSVFSIRTEKTISKYRPVATISKIEIVSH